jgi:hypothetical protein
MLFKPLLVSALSFLFVGGSQQRPASQGQPTQPRFPPPEATVPADGVTVPIVALVPNPIVEVKVNGQGPFRFMLDTGGQGYARASQDPTPPSASELARAGELFGARCASCHLPPDPAFAVDRAWLHQVYDTA